MEDSFELFLDDIDSLDELSSGDLAVSPVLGEPITNNISNELDDIDEPDDDELDDSGRLSNEEDEKEDEYHNDFLPSLPERPVKPAKKHLDESIGWIPLDEITVEDVELINETIQLSNLLLNEAKSNPAMKEWKQVKNEIRIISRNKEERKDPQKLSNKIKNLIEKFLRKLYFTPDDPMYLRIIKFMINGALASGLSLGLTFANPILSPILAGISGNFYGSTQARYYYRYLIKKIKYCENKAKTAKTPEERKYWQENADMLNKNKNKINKRAVKNTERYNKVVRKINHESLSFYGELIQENIQL